MSTVAVAIVLTMLAQEPAARVVEPLSVKASPAKKAVRLNQPFDVRLRVVNTSKETQSFRVMNCSWDEHWKSDTPAVTWVGWNCTKNFPVTVTLKRGEAYEKTLPMVVTKGEPGDRVSFQMGFKPIDGKLTYWSGKLTVKVEKGKPE
jgi:hypothetical protein